MYIFLKSSVSFDVSSDVLTIVKKRQSANNCNVTIQNFSPWHPVLIIV